MHLISSARNSTPHNVVRQFHSRTETHSGNFTAREWSQRLSHAIIFVVTLSLLSCAQTREYPPGSVIEGVMQKVEIEGGCWVFVADDGQKYELVGSETGRLRKEGLRARIAIKPRADLASICMVGKIVEVVEILKTIP